MLQSVKFFEVTFVAKRVLTVNTLPTSGSEIDFHNLTPDQKAELISCLDRYPEPPVWQLNLSATLQRFLLSLQQELFNWLPLWTTMKS